MSDDEIMANILTPQNPKSLCENEFEHDILQNSEEFYSSSEELEANVAPLQTSEIMLEDLMKVSTLQKLVTMFQNKQPNKVQIYSFVEVQENVPFVGFAIWWLEHRKMAIFYFTKVEKDEVIVTDFRGISSVQNKSIRYFNNQALILGVAEPACCTSAKLGIPQNFCWKTAALADFVTNPKNKPNYATEMLKSFTKYLELQLANDNQDSYSVRKVCLLSLLFKTKNKNTKELQNYFSKKPYYLLPCKR